jgi:hypothetical protein
MRHRSDITKYGIVALAGIAILGWIREPERHGSRDLILHGSAQPRATFSPPPGAPDGGISVTGAPAPDYATDYTTEAQTSLESRPVPVIPSGVQSGSGHAKRPPAVTKTPEPVAANGGRYEAVEMHEHGSETRSREPDGARDASTRAVESPSKTGDDGQLKTERSQTASDTTARSQTQSAHTKQRSTARSAAIIAGSAAAGAAIGGITAGGKGVAIGAVSGGAGGYIYDRITRPKSTSVPGMGAGSDSGRRSDAADYMEAEDAETRRPSLARRFGSPAFQ